MQIILYLTRNKKIVSSTELSGSLHISKRYIIQIAGKLRDGCLIETHAGMSGGYTLGKEASAISVYDIFSLFEGDICIPQCVNQCNNDSIHTALSTLKEYLDVYLKVLTLDQLADMDTYGRLSEVIRIAETQMVAIKNS